MDENIDALKRKIQEAFNEVTYPGDENIVSHQCLECGQLANEFRGRHWNEMTHESASRLGISGPSLFTPEAYRFYMPFFLIMLITRRQEIGFLMDQILSSLISPSKDRLRKMPNVQPIERDSHLTPQDKEWLIKTMKDVQKRREEGGTTEHFARRMAIMTSTEMKVIISVLNFIRAEPNIDDSLGGEIKRAIESLEEVLEQKK